MGPVKIASNKKRLEDYYFFSGGRGSLSAPSSLSKNTKFDPTKIQKFAQNDPTLSKFYPIVRRQKNAVQGTNVYHVLERVHIDLANFRNEDSTTFIYGLVARDCYSQKTWNVPTVSKNAKHMLEAFKQLLGKFKGLQARFPTLTKNITFYSDAGLEFTSKAVTSFLSKEGHRNIYLRSERKSYYAELAIRLYRQKLAILKSKVGPKRFKEVGGWVNYNDIILRSMNNSPSRALCGFTPNQVYSMNVKALASIQARQPKFDIKNWFKWKQRKLKEGQKYINQYCKIVMRFKNYFVKRSQKQRISDTVYKIVRVRPPSMQHPKNKCLLKLEDLAKHELPSWFQVDQVVLIPTSSRFNPSVKNWKPTVSEIISKKKKPDGKLWYTVRFLGKFFTPFLRTQNSFNFNLKIITSGFIWYGH